MPRVFNGLKLKELRQAAGMSQAELAEAAGVPQPNVSNWEQGRKQPYLANIVAIAKALGVQPLVFLEQGGGEKPGRGRPKKERGQGQA